MSGRKSNDPRGANHGGQKRSSNRNNLQCTTDANSPLVRAKDRIRIPEAWERLGLPGQPAKACKSPFREERNPSFSVFNEGQRWHDFASGESGDVVDLIARARGISAKEAARLLIEWSGGAGGSITRGHCEPVKPRPPAKDAKPLPHLPKLRKPSFSEVRAIQIQRQLPFNAGLEIAVQRGLLWTGRMYGHECWIATDDARCNAQGRPLDGLKFGADRQGPKCLDCRHPVKEWPIGAANLGDAPNVILTEGPADMLAAMTLAWHEQFSHDWNIDQIGFACVSGSGVKRLASESLPYFQGRNVRIVYDEDHSGAGLMAAKRWRKQLAEAGAKVDGYSLKLAGALSSSGSPAKDVNEATFLASDEGETDSHVQSQLSIIFSFDGACVGKETVR